MEFLQPLMFWALGLIPVLILIHLLKPKPKRLDVTNLFLWDEIFRERSSNLTLKRLQRNLPLLLQILLVLLLALALARPVWLYFTQKHGNLILVIDTSASMKTRCNAEETRFDLARRNALEVLDEREPGQHILIIDAGSEPSLLGGFLDNAVQAEQIIRGLLPTDAPAKLEKAIYLALSFVDPAREDEIYLITDGAGGEFERLIQIHPHIQPVLISGGQKNVGITKFEFRQMRDLPYGYEMMVELRNFSAETVECPLQLSIDKAVIGDEVITLEPQEKQLLIYPYIGLISGIARAELDIQDDFETDNGAYLSFNETKDIWILFATKGNYFLEKLLEVYPNFLVNPVNEILPSSWEAQTARHDIVIVDRMNFPAVQQGNFLLFNAFSPAIPIQKSAQTVDFPTVYDWDSSSPLMKDVNVSGLTIESAAVLEADAAAHPVVEAEQTGLVYTYQQDNLRAVLFGFDVTRSDLPLRVAFPVMISNIVNWLNPQKLDLSSTQIQAGQPYQIYLAPDTQEISVRPPRERWQTFPMTDNPYTYTETNQVGVYSIAEDEKTRYFTVNLVNESESDIRVPVVDLAAQQAAAVEAQEIETQQPLWTLFLLISLAVLMLEWQVWLIND